MDEILRYNIVALMLDIALSCMEKDPTSKKREQAMGH
jgi:hypothetical protein